MLKEYKAKRDFKKSPEPKAEISGKENKEALFVVQKHQATRLHYDFRLEIKGVLKSWAVPKGPPLNPADKRLAVSVEDHPLDYAGFEGVIPKGQYGAGTVRIWDKGNYRNIKKTGPGKENTISESYDKGKIEVELKGKKLKGNFALIRMKQNKQWLLIKMKNKHESDS